MKVRVLLVTVLLMISLAACSARIGPEELALVLLHLESLQHETDQAVGTGAHLLDMYQADMVEQESFLADVRLIRNNLREQRNEVLLLPVPQPLLGLKQQALAMADSSSMALQYAIFYVETGQPVMYKAWLREMELTQRAIADFARALARQRR